MLTAKEISRLNCKLIADKMSYHKYNLLQLESRFT